MYRLLLWLAFPRRLRQAFGDEMLRLFEAQREDVRTSGGSVTRLWLAAIADATVHGIGERLARVEDVGWRPFVNSGDGGVGCAHSCRTSGTPRACSSGNRA